METCLSDTIVCTSPPTYHQFTFKNRLCVFCALPLDLQREQVASNWSSLNEDTFINGVSVLRDALSIKEHLNGLFKDGGGVDNWRLLGIDNFVQWICCENCFKLISQLVSLHQLIVKSQISLKENARKLENFVVVSSQAHDPKTDEFEAPSLEYSLHACVVLRQEILNNFSKKDQPPPEPKPKDHLSRKPKTVRCDKQAVVLLKRLELFPPPPPIIPDITPFPTKEIGDDEFNCPSPLSPETMETDEDTDTKHRGKDLDYQPIKKRRRPTGRKRGRPKTNKPPKSRGKPGRPRKINQDPPPSFPNKLVKRKRTPKPDFFLIEEEDDSQLKINQHKKVSAKKLTTIPSTKAGRPIRIGSRHYHFLHEGSGPKLHCIYFLSMSPPFGSPEEKETPVYLMIYNVKFSKTSTSLHCLHPQCSHKETLTGYFTDQTILRNMRFHIRFAHRSLPKKDKPEENKPSFYFCHLCELQMDSKLTLLEHRREMHKEEEQLPPFCFCEVCGDPNVALGDLVQHMFSHKSELEKEDILKKGSGKDKDILKPIIHPCDQCDKCFKCHTELMTHRSTHVPLELRQIVCEICGKGCKSKWAVEHHKKRVHLKALPIVFECHVCGKGFMRCQKPKYEEHLNMHTGEKPYQCEQCGKRFIGKWHLTKHVRAVHGGVIERVSCEFCGKIYKHKNDLRKHSLKKHGEEMKIMGRVTSKENKDKYKPLDQREDFIGPKLMFPCEPCGKVFIFRSMLITHLKNKHKMFYERKEDYPWQMTAEDVIISN